MSIITTGTSIAEFDLSGVLATTAVNLLSANVVEGLSINESGNYFVAGDMSGGAEVWLKFTLIFLSNNGAINSSQRFVEFRGAGDTNFIRVITAAGVSAFSGYSDLLLQNWNGSSWVTVETFNGFASGNNVYDIQLSVAVAGVFRIYRNSILLYEYSGNTQFNGVVGVDRVRVGGCVRLTHGYSAVILADEDTRPLRYVQLLPTQGGALAQWTGAPANVLGTSFSDSTFMSTDAQDQKHTFVLPNLASEFDTGWDVVGLFASARAVRDIDKTAAIRLMSYNNTAEAFGPQVTLEAFNQVVKAQFLVDPDTSAAWTVTGINSAEIGVQSRAPL